MLRWLPTSLLSLLLPLALWSLPARAQTPPSVSQATAGFIADCRQAGGRAFLSPGFQTVADLNEDGLPDFILDGNHVECSAPPPNCGSGGCYSEIHVSGPGGWRRVFGAHVYSFRVNRATRPPTLTVSWHGTRCNRVGAEGCVQSLAWDGRGFAIVSTAARQPVVPAQGWGVRRSGERLMAYAPGQAPLRELSFTCANDRAFIAVVLHAAQPVADAMLTATIDGRKFDAVVSSAPAHPTIYIADVSTTGLVQAVADARDRIAVTLNGTSLGTVTSSGSAAQLRTALAACPPP